MKGATGARETIFMLLLMLTAMPSLQAAESLSDIRNVVILNSTDPDLPAYIALSGAIKTQLAAAAADGSGPQTQILTETLDMHRFPQAQIKSPLVELLRHKYRNLKVDVLVAAAPAALDFAMRYRAELWPGAPIVFHSIPSSELQQRQLPDDIVGVPVELGIDSTLALARTLQPETRKLVVISGSSLTDESMLARAQADITPYLGELKVRYLTNLTQAELFDAVQELRSDTIVLFLTLFRDGAGNPQVPGDVVRRIAAVSPVPVFGVFETYLGDGIAAGSIISYADQGRRAGELVIRILNGEAPTLIGNQPPITPTCIADAQQLSRWNLDASLLPPDCEVRFAEPSIWDLYHRQILLTLAILLLQSALIFFLMLNRRRLQLTTSELQQEHDRRTAAEAFAEGLRERLARFSKERSLGTMATAISHEINQPLLAIQNYASAAGRRLSSGEDDREKLRDLITKISEQAERAGSITQHVRSLVNQDNTDLLPIQMKPLLVEVIEMLEPECRNLNCQIVCTSDDAVPKVLADPLQVQLVLVNLLHNAMHSVSASDDFDRTLRIDLRARDDHLVQISVMDHGPGVAADRISQLFEPLYSGTSGGMGMGLSIARSIIDAHDGKIWYEPNPDGGAVFCFTLKTVST